MSLNYFDYTQYVAREQLLILFLGFILTLTIMTFGFYLLQRYKLSGKRLGVSILKRPDGNFTLKYCWSQVGVAGSIIREENLSMKEVIDKINKLIENTKWERN